MNKSELVETVAESADISKAAADKAIGAVTSAIIAAVANGDSVKLVGFGTFSRQVRAARNGRNPATGETIKLPASAGPKFSAGASFKAAVAARTGKKK